LTSNILSSAQKDTKDSSVKTVSITTPHSFKDQADQNAIYVLPSSSTLFELLDL